MSKEHDTLLNIANDYGRESDYYEALIIQRGANSFLEIRHNYDTVGYTIGEKSGRYDKFMPIISTMDFGNTLESAVEMWMNNPEKSFSECDKFFYDKKKITLKTRLPRIFNGWTKRLGGEKAAECAKFLDMVEKRFLRYFDTWGKNKDSFDFSVRADDNTIYINADKIPATLAYQLNKEPRQDELDNFIYNVLTTFTDENEADVEESYRKLARKKNERFNRKPSKKVAKRNIHESSAEGYAVMQISGSTKRCGGWFPTYKEAEEFCDYYDWEWMDENGFVWSLIIEEESEEDYDRLCNRLYRNRRYR